jgi:histidinol dehydrogenase
LTELLPKIRVSTEEIAELVSKIRKGSHDLPKVESRVRRVIQDVRKRGDAALLDYTRKFDGVSLSKKELLVREGEIDRATRRVEKKLLMAMRFSLKRLRAAQGGLLKGLRYSQESNGFKMRLISRPLSSLGCYIPGGRAAYASSVLMTAGLASAVGVKRIVVCTPPNAKGDVSDATLAATSLCRVDEVYRVGGAQAIAAMAYGTRTIRGVDKIVGPGGIFVAAAKRLVSSDVPIDFFAGPTELVIAADESSNPRSVAWDLVGQSEHGQDSICGLVTWSDSLADEVRREVARIVPRVGRREHVEGCLRRGFAAVCGGRRQAADLINELAPEHLQVMVANPEKFTALVQNAGLILNGEYSPCAASDYCVGTDHVIPTEGFARFRGGLSALDFVKTVWMVEGSREGLRRIVPSLKALAYAEGLPNHFLSVESRFRE